MLPSYIPLKKSTFALTIGLLCLFTNTYAQKYDPFDGKAQDFHVQLTRYFKSQEDEKASLKLLSDSTAAFHKDSVWNLNNLRAHLDRYESLLVSLQRHLQYYRLVCYKNNKDTLAQHTGQKIDESIDELQDATNSILQKTPFTAINSTQLSKYFLVKYQYLLVQAKQNAAHNLSTHDDHLINTLLDAHLIDRYDALMDNVKADSITYNGKKYNPVNDKQIFLKSPDSLLRKMGMTAYYQAYANHGEILAATLIDITKQRTALFKAYGFKSAPERTYARKLQLSEASVKQMLTEMTTHADVLKAYQQLQTDQVKRVTGISHVHSWDTTLPMGFTWQPLPFSQVRPLVLDALAPLGTEYVQHFAYLLNPTNGELDIAPGPNRVTEFTSVGFPRVPESLYMKSYGGALSDVSHLIHEGGHAIHEQLISENLSVPSYVQGPNFLFESYAMLNELLLLDALEKKDTTVKGKAFYTKQFLDKLSLEVFTSAEEGAFEQGLYDGVTAGNINTQADVDSLYAGIMNKYDIYFPNEPQRHSEWINKRLVFDDPLYNVNYLYAMLVTCKLYELQHTDPKTFATNYTALLKNGFNAPVNVLLKKFMGFDLDNTTLLSGALQLMRDKTAQLKALYAQY